MALSTLRPLNIARDDDILVVGYIKSHIEKQYDMTIPEDVIKVCHSYWGSFGCDIWDKNFINSGYCKINDYETIVTSLTNEHYCIYGTHIVKSGVYKWTLKLNATTDTIQENHPFIGIIKNKEAHLNKYKTSCMWNRNQGGYFLCGKSGKIVPPGTGRKWGQATFKNVNDILEVILDLDNLTLGFSTNGKDEAIAFKGIHKQEYRLSVGMLKGNKCQIELL